MAKKTTIPKEEKFTTPSTNIKEIELGDINLSQEEIEQLQLTSQSIEGTFYGEKGVDIDQLKIIAEYAEALVVNLEGIFIGGHAAQTRGLLFEALSKYRNGN